MPIRMGEISRYHGQLNYCNNLLPCIILLQIYNDIKRNPREQGLITKKYIAIDTNYSLNLKMAYTPVP